MLIHVDTQLIDGNVVIRLKRPFRKALLVYVYLDGSPDNAVAKSRDAANSEYGQWFAERLLYRFLHEQDVPEGYPIRKGPDYINPTF